MKLAHCERLPVLAGTEERDAKAPGLLMMALEARAPWELLASQIAKPLLRGAPRGDGHPVIVFPGLVTGDFSTLVLRNYIAAQGYAAYAWEQGLNLGPRPGVVEACMDRVRQLRRLHGEPVSLIGWSLGGIYAREIAKQIPGDVRLVVSMGTPFAGGPKSTNAWRLYELTSGQRIDETPPASGLRAAPPVPTTSIFSRTDGIVAWRASVERDSARSENIEIQSSHFGMPMHPAALYAIADRLAQPRGSWQRFDRDGMSGLKRLVYRRAE